MPLNAENVALILRCAECEAVWLPADEERWRAYLTDDEPASPAQLAGDPNAFGAAGEPNAKGVGWLDWPCGQNPGRKPDGHQRASAREAMSLGEQSSDLQGQELAGSALRQEAR